ncbi:NAD-dependent epimerase/dehydratase family protein [Brevibacterium sp. BRM-1]|uniref:NAD-dependent epimerase/dehydratase family protein n=1 Tax=Brevibacterium sp. BRM-1 TaxID=2999062 RepID=UPI002282683F|nr:NAD-dependent epimerase/dehydratase family protein [Brevibacterium sp. BRM-1]WAL39289.1 NAD-dependent epimerase/dehydratase family protein [Brevibacterium sp. BRM-1]
MVDQQRPVLVTGGTGFIAAYCMAQLLAQGRTVRTTVRSAGSQQRVREAVARAGEASGFELGEVVAGLEFATADHMDDAGWAAAMEGCDGVLHVASPVPAAEPKDPQEVIAPAREGTLRVLGAAEAAGVSRVVMTSSFGAVGFGFGSRPPRFDEDSWTRLAGPGVSAYTASKTLAEQDAWEFAAQAGPGFELVALCPTAVFGPVLGPSVSGGNELIRRMLAGALPGLLDMWFPVVDVRDVAAAHAAALTAAEAAGRRFIVGGREGMTMAQIAGTLRQALGARAAKVPTRRIPNWLVRAAARVVPAARDFAAELGGTKEIDVSRAERVLGLRARPARETIAQTGRSMLERGAV